MLKMKKSKRQARRATKSVTLEHRPRVPDPYAGLGPVTFTIRPTTPYEAAQGARWWEPWRHGPRLVYSSAWEVKE